MAERFELLTEQLEIIDGLWRTPPGQRFSHDGTHYQVHDSPALPKPAQQPRPPIIIGGGGATKTPALAARFADEFNLPFSGVDKTRAQFERVRAACERAGRDPGSLVLSAAVTVACGATEAEFDRRAEAIGRKPENMRAFDAGGTPGEVVERLHAYRDIGAERIYLQILDLADLDHVRLLAAEVLPHV